jgi:glycosyltransferase involved in cell wall biosynthesis
VRIAIDARELAGRSTGVGRFLAQVLREWQTTAGTAGHEVVLCAPDAVSTPVSSAWRVEVEPGRGTLWEQRVLPRLAERVQADVLFCPAYSGPATGSTPLVVAIHDVSFFAHPEWFRWREGLRRRFFTRRAAHRAARVITISQFSKREIAEHVGVPESKIDVIHLAPAPMAVVPRDRPEPLILYLGSIFNRRHVPETIRGFARLARRHGEARLTIVGDNRTFPYVDLNPIIADRAQEDRVTVRPYVPDDELAALYGRARAFVFLSEYEGFGLTPLDALAAGIPIVVLDTAVAREVYGEAAIYVGSPDPRAIEPALERALYDEAERARVLAAAAGILPRYSWTTCAAGVLRVLEAAAR